MLYDFFYQWVTAPYGCNAWPLSISVLTTPFGPLYGGACYSGMYPLALVVGDTPAGSCWWTKVSFLTRDGGPIPEKSPSSPPLSAFISAWSDEVCTPYFSWAGTCLSLSPEMVTWVHFCQGCVPCVRGPGLEGKILFLIPPLELAI